MKRSIMIINICIWIIAGTVAQESVTLQDAIKMSHEGKYGIADSILNKLLLANQDVAVQRAKAFNYSWWGKQDQAIAIFKQLLKDNKYDTSAHIGLGFAHVFAGSYANAYYDFMNVLRMDPNHEEAQKGLAYKYLYEGNLDKSEEYFHALTILAPKEEEYKIALGRIALAKKENEEGLAISEEVLQSNPRSSDARVLQNNAKTNDSNLEVNMWGGFTQTTDKYSYGLRTLQVQYLTASGLRVGSRFDNSLATDNYRLFSQYTFAPAVWASLGIKLRPNIISNFEIGNRFLDGNTPLARGEIVFFGYKSSVLKVGYFSALSTKNKEYNANVGIELPVLKDIRMGTMYFYGRESRFSKNTFRWLLTSKIKIDAFTLDVGYFVGNNGIPDESLNNQQTRGFFTITNLPIGTKFSWMTLINHEKALNNKITTFSTGLTYKIF